MPTMLGLTALKSGCHIPSAQPFTSICGGLFGSRLIQPTQTALNPLAPAGSGRGLPAQAENWPPGCAAAILLQHRKG